MKKVAVLTLLVMSLPLAGALQAQAPVPVSVQFQVNSYTTSRQQSPAVAVGAQGDFVVVWESDGSYGTDASHHSVQAQLYDASGLPQGGEFQVNSYTTITQSQAVVGVGPSGDIVVVWTSVGSHGGDTDGGSIQAQLYDASGLPQGGEFQVNSYTTNVQWNPAMAVGPGGDFVVVWESDGSYGTDTSANSIQGQRYDAAGNPQGSQFQVNSYTWGSQSIPAVASGPVGGFVVVWDGLGSNGTDTSNWSVKGRRFAADGSPKGGDFQVNSYTTSFQGGPAVAVDGQGDFVVVWFSEGSYGTDSSYWSVQAQRFAASGSRQGGEFQVNSYTTSYQVSPAVAADAEGNFIVAWASDGSNGTDTNGFSIQGQHFDVSGAPVGGQFQVNSYTTDYQGMPAVAVDGQGDFVVVWDSSGSDGTDTDSSSTQGQRFSVPIFTDGFESGDTTAWSSAVP